MLLETLQRASQDVLGTLTVEPERVSASDAAKVFGVLNDLERAVVAGKTLFAGRAADAGVWREQGHKSADPLKPPTIT
jgi:hypothetical protein